jgi:multiple sugar transport system substrate-binding protein
VIGLEHFDAWLYQTSLHDVSDLASEITQKLGDIYPFGRDTAFVGNRWLGIAHYWFSFPGSYRKDLFEQVGETAPDTWQDLLAAGRKLKQLGHPVGIPISQCSDSVVSMLSILWSFAGRVMEVDGKTIVINSKETAESIDYVKTFYIRAGHQPEDCQGTRPDNSSVAALPGRRGDPMSPRD